MPTKKKSALGAPSTRVYTKEADLLDAVTDWLEPQRRDGIMLLRICDRYAKGYSDLFINVRGQFVVAELKDDEGEPSVHQEQFIEDMVACGAIGGVCRTVKEVADLVDEAKRRTPDWTSTIRSRHTLV